VSATQRRRCSLARPEHGLRSGYVDALLGYPPGARPRRHPMGVLVDQRSPAMELPDGPNQDIVYFVFTLYNVTARSNGVYANPTIPVELQRRSPAWDAPSRQC